MKKNYLSPEVKVALVKIEVNFLASDPSVSSGQDLIFDDEVDPW